MDISDITGVLELRGDEVIDLGVLLHLDGKNVFEGRLQTTNAVVSLFIAHSGLSVLVRGRFLRDVRRRQEDIRLQW